MKWKTSFMITIRFLMIFTLTGAFILAIGYFTPRKSNQVSPQPCAYTIYVAGNNVHTNLIVPVKTRDFDWSNQFNLSEIGRHRSNDYHFLSFGWGDRYFYLNTPTLRDVNIWISLRALLLPTKTVVHIQGHFSVPLSSPNYQVNALRVSRKDYLNLNQFLVSYLAQNSEGEPILIQQSHRYSGSFYEAKGSYSIFQTCNDWTALGLRAANVNTPLWSGLAGSVFQHLQANCIK